MKYLGMVLIFITLLIFANCSKEKTTEILIIKEYPINVAFAAYEPIPGNTKLFSATGLVDSSFIDNNLFIKKYFGHLEFMGNVNPGWINLYSKDSCAFVYMDGHMVGYHTVINNQSISIFNHTDTIVGNFNLRGGPYYFEKGFAVSNYNSQTKTSKNSFHLGNFDLKSYNLQLSDSLLVSEIKLIYRGWYID